MQPIPAATWAPPLRQLPARPHQGRPALVGKHQDFLIVTGLAGTSKDVAALTEDGAHLHDGRRHGRRLHDRLGLALARRDARVPPTGDGDC